MLFQEWGRFTVSQSAGKAAGSSVVLAKAHWAFRFRISRMGSSSFVFAVRPTDKAAFLYLYYNKPTAELLEKYFGLWVGFLLIFIDFPLFLYDNTKNIGIILVYPHKRKGERLCLTNRSCNFYRLLSKNAVCRCFF
jgi:hypothetical protein